MSLCLTLSVAIMQTRKVHITIGLLLFDVYSEHWWQSPKIGLRCRSWTESHFRLRLLRKKAPKSMFPPFIFSDKREVQLRWIHGDQVNADLNATYHIIPGQWAKSARYVFTFSSKLPKNKTVAQFGFAVTTKIIS